MSSIHTFNIETTQPQAVSNGGTRTMANKRNFSLLKGMALYSLRLYSGGVREPHWHPGEPGGFGGYVVGEMLAGYIGLGGHPAGASYKILSLIGHGAKSIVYPLVISRYGSSQLLRVVFDSDYK